MTYALALSHRTGLRLFDFVCSWFDQEHYYEFYPLHVVYNGVGPNAALAASVCTRNSRQSLPRCQRGVSRQMQSISLLFPRR